LGGAGSWVGVKGAGAQGRMPVARWCLCCSGRRRKTTGWAYRPLGHCFPPDEMGRYFAGLVGAEPNSVIKARAQFRVELRSKLATAHSALSTPAPPNPTCGETGDGWLSRWGLAWFRPGREIADDVKEDRSCPTSTATAARNLAEFKIFSPTRRVARGGRCCPEPPCKKLVEVRWRRLARRGSFRRELRANKTPFKSINTVILMVNA
jgi:hypothetical protein